MRTATLLAKTHDGNWELLANPDSSIVKQNEQMKQFLMVKSHAKYCQVIYQESDGFARVHRLNSPEQQKASDALRAKETKAAEDAGKEFLESVRQAALANEGQRIKTHESEISELDKKTLAAANRGGKAKQ